MQILNHLVISCLNDHPEKRPSVEQVLTEIKKDQKSYSEKLCSSIWATKVTGEQQQVEEQRLLLQVSVHVRIVCICIHASM